MKLFRTSIGKGKVAVGMVYLILILWSIRYYLIYGNLFVEGHDSNIEILAGIIMFVNIVSTIAILLAFITHYWED
tara:strand:- start:78877 stop:79101 length:225 start_codon:yes stop_codon:yes gene_type:complete